MVIFFIVLCIVIFVSNLNTSGNNDNVVDEELKLLIDMEKELAKNDNYDKTSFEEEELEEDDYYYEDEK